MHYKLPILEEKGFVVLKDYDGPEIPEHEFKSLEFMDWKSGGDTNFAPIATADGPMLWQPVTDSKNNKIVEHVAR